MGPPGPQGAPGPPGSADAWSRTGNAGTTPGVNFLGTTDNQPLELRVNNQPVLRLIPNGDNTPNVIVGYAGNSMAAGVVGATIGGGGDTEDGLGDPQNNHVSANFGTVSGGTSNTASGDRATVGGGRGNATSGLDATVGGGWSNTASGNHATVGGGAGNIASGSYATIPGGLQNTAGNFAFAAGRCAKASHTGAFVWADLTDADFASTGINQFLIRAGRGVGINNNAPVVPLTVAGSGPYNEIGAAAIAVRNTAANKTWEWHVLDDGRMQLADFSLGATRLLIDTVGNVSALAFVPTSDREAKEQFEAVDPAEVLERVADLPLSRWQFKEDTSGARHLGPMAQDFYAAFGLGTDHKHIATVDADGVALAAIQGLNQKVEVRSQESEVRIQKLEAENAELKAEVSELKRRDAENAALKARLERLEQLLNQPLNPNRP